MTDHVINKNNLKTINSKTALTKISFFHHSPHLIICHFFKYWPNLTFHVHILIYLLFILALTKLAAKCSIIFASLLHIKTIVITVLLVKLLSFFIFIDVGSVIDQEGDASSSNITLWMALMTMSFVFHIRERREINF